MCLWERWIQKGVICWLTCQPVCLPGCGPDRNLVRWGLERGTLGGDQRKMKEGCGTWPWANRRGATITGWDGVRGTEAEGGEEEKSLALDEQENLGG